MLFLWSEVTSESVEVERDATNHGFVQDTTSSIVHLVELVDTADASIAQNKSSTVENMSSDKFSSGNKKAYLSNTSCLESGSRVTYAVKPTADEPLPEVYTPRGAIL